MLTADHLLTVVDAYRDARKVSDSRVSALLFNDGKRIGMLRRGGDIGSRHLAAAFQWLSDNWPEPSPWPSAVQRPLGRDGGAAVAEAPRNPIVPVLGSASEARERAKPLRCHSPHGSPEFATEGQSR